MIERPEERRFVPPVFTAAAASAVPYEPPRYVEPRTSKLAIASLILALLPVLRLAKLLSIGAFWALLFVATASSIIAVARARASRGELRQGMAWLALLVSGLWWLLIAVFFALMLLIAAGGWQD